MNKFTVIIFRRWVKNPVDAMYIAYIDNCDTSTRAIERAKVEARIADSDKRNNINDYRLGVVLDGHAPVCDWGFDE